MAFYVGGRLLLSPNFVFLLPEGGGQWIRSNRPFEMSLLPLGVHTETFRVRFEVDEVPEEAVLTVRALRRVIVRLDEEVLLGGNTPYEEWRTARQIDLAPGLGTGTHELEFEVSNENGAVALLAYCEALGIATQPGWEHAAVDADWDAAVSVDVISPPDFSRDFPRTDKALFNSAALLLPIFVLFSWWRYSFLRAAGPAIWLRKITPSASGVRWIVIGAWTILAVNNIGKIPYYYGYDVLAHVEYVAFVAKRHTLPIATDGFEMFQAPLYYVLSAPIHALSSHFLTGAGIVKAVRVVPLLCGIAQVELSYRAAKLAFPKTQSIQIMSTLLGGFVPLNLYMSQYASNQPLAGALSGLVIVSCLALLVRSDKHLTPRDGVMLGALVGLSLLAKVSSVLLLFPLLVVCVFLTYSSSANETMTLAKRWSPVALMAITAFVVAGWWYIRNQILIGKPFGIGFDPALGIEWRQDPGFRTFSQMMDFGEALRYPVYSGFRGFWDSLYSTLWFDGWLSGSPFPSRDHPPWNYNLALATCLLSILPMFGMFVGVGLCALRLKWSRDNGLLFLTLYAGSFAGGLLYLYLDLPIFACGKASYALGVLPCIAVLGAVGLKAIQKTRAGDIIVTGWFACWVAAAYLGYFVVR